MTQISPKTSAEKKRMTTGRNGLIGVLKESHADFLTNGGSTLKEAYSKIKKTWAKQK